MERLLRGEIRAAVNPQTKQPYTYKKDGFEATRYELPTDQYGTQLDPPAHWAPEYPAIDELPATYAVRPLVVISIVDQLAKDAGYHLQRADIQSWESRNGKVPPGSVVMVRSDWSKKWPDPALAEAKTFPGVSLDALKFLHEERRILFHGHEPLDTDTTPNLEGEHWLLHHGYTQAEGVANLDQVPEKGCLITIGFPKFAGGLGGYARFVGDLPGKLEIRLFHRRGPRSAPAQERQDSPVGRAAWHARAQIAPRPLTQKNFAALENVT